MRFRFTIRDLFWLTLLVALLAAWRMDNWSWFHTRIVVTTRLEDGIKKTVLVDNDTGESWERQGSEWVQRR